MKIWQLQRAKAELSKVVKDLKHGPQAISLYEKVVAIILSKDEYDKLIKPKPSFVQFMRQSPLVGMNIRLKRNRSMIRKIKL